MPLNRPNCPAAASFSHESAAAQVLLRANTRVERFAVAVHLNWLTETRLTGKLIPQPFALIVRLTRRNLFVSALVIVPPKGESEPIARLGQAGAPETVGTLIRVNPAEACIWRYR